MNIVLLLSHELKQSYVIEELSKIYSIRGVVIEDKYTPQNRIKTVLQQAGCNPFKIAGIVHNKYKVGKFESRDNKIIERYFSGKERRYERGESSFIQIRCKSLKAERHTEWKMSAPKKHLPFHKSSGLQRF